MEFKVVLRRFISSARYVGALVCATALALAVSVHAADRNPTFEGVRSYGQTLTTHFSTTLAPLSDFVARAFHASPRRIALLAPDHLSARTVPSVQSEGGPSQLALVPPSILDFKISDGGHANVQGAATPGVRVALFHGDAIVADTRATAAGRWQVQIDNHMAHGVHTLQAVTWVESTGRRLLSETVRLAVPQRLPREQQSPNVAQAKPSLGAVRLAQRDPANNDRRRATRQVDPDDEPSWTAPIFGWLRWSSETYADVIARDLSGEDAATAFVFENDQGRQRDFSPEFERDERVRSFDRGESLTDTLYARWQGFSVGVIEWMRQARETYEARVVDELRGAERRVVRRPDVRDDPFDDAPDRRPIERDFAESYEDDVPARIDRRVAPVPRVFPPTREPEPVEVTPPRAEQPLDDWPVVGDVAPNLPDLPTVEPDPEKQELIRKAEQDAQKARELAKQAADRARKLREETEALLAESQRLKEEAAKRREADLKKQLEESEQRARLAEQRAREAAQRRAETETEAGPTGRETREAAEDLAAAASQEADKRFADGGLDVPTATGQKPVAEGSQAGDVGETEERFTVAEAGPARRLSLKDNARDRIIEEGSTMGEIDDFDPSVRFVYDMGTAAPAKAKRTLKSKNRAYRKKAYRTKKAKRRGYYKRKKRRARQRARNRRAYLRRATRVRRARHRARRSVYRSGKRWRRVVQRRFGRLYKFKPSARPYRKRRYARGLYMPRIKWR